MQGHTAASLAHMRPMLCSCYLAVPQALRQCTSQPTGTWCPQTHKLQCTKTECMHGHTAALVTHMRPMLCTCCLTAHMAAMLALTVHACPAHAAPAAHPTVRRWESLKCVPVCVCVGGGGRLHMVTMLTHVT